ncbi:swarming motility protein [Gammaproteobacteria bacterium]|nr:swarming motility protein [Gammaproteobacteria bacterium]
MNVHLFYSGCFSQWHKSDFSDNGLIFNCAEQYMMYSKALLFSDKSSASDILLAQHPRTQKMIGRKIKNFDEQIWLFFRGSIVFSANYAKFSQSDDLKSMLLNTGSSIIAEASPSDKIWGIGLAESDQLALNPKNWKGMNLLGIALMQVRASLRGENIELNKP